MSASADEAGTADRLRRIVRAAEVVDREMRVLAWNRSGSIRTAT